MRGTPGAAGTAYPNELMWAFDGASGRWRGKRGPIRGPGVVHRAYGYTIIAAHDTIDFGRSVHSRARLDHVVDTLWTAWCHGVFVGAMIRWMCGATTTWFELIRAPAGTVCGMCVLQTAKAWGYSGLNFEMEEV